MFPRFRPVKTRNVSILRHVWGAGFGKVWALLLYDVLVHVPQVCWGLSGRGQVLGSSLFLVSRVLHPWSIFG